MFGALLKKELLDSVQSFRFALVVALFAGLMPLSLWVMGQHYSQSVQLYQAGQGLHWDNLKSIQKIKTQHDQADALNDYGLYDSLAPKPLGFLVRGLEEVLPYQINVCDHFVRQSYPEAYRNPLFALYSTPDLGHLVLYAASLAMLFFAFDAVRTERRQGTLPLVLSHQVPRHHFLLAKWCGAYLCVAMPFLFVLGWGLAFAHLTNLLPLQGEEFWRLLGLLGLALIYIALFCSLGILVSVAFADSSTALLIALTVWIGWNLAIPQLAPTIARILYPAHSLPYLEATLSATPKPVRAQQQRIRQNEEMDKTEKKHLLSKIAAAEKRRQQNLRTQQHNQRQLQQAMGQGLARLSPAASFRYAATALAGTGIEYYHAYLKGLEGFNQAYRSYNDGVWEKLSYKENRQAAPKWLHKDEVPRLHIINESLDSTLARITTDLGLLLGQSLLLFGAAHLVFTRRDIR